MDESGFPVPVGRLVQIHEIHVDGIPREIAIELRVQMEEGLAQGGEATDPHLRGREGVHPKNQPGAGRVGVRFEYGLTNRFRCRQDRLEHQLGGEAQFAGDGSCVGRNLIEGLGAVEVLTAGQEPDFRSFHCAADCLMLRRSFMVRERSAEWFTPPKASWRSR